MPFVVAMVVVGALLVVALVAVAREPGPGAGESPPGASDEREDDGA